METVNKLSKAQEVLGQEIKRIHTNIKKDPLNRKTLQYVEERRTQVQKLWNEVKVNDTQLKELKTLETQHATYFASNYFEQIRTIYNDALQELNNCKEKLLDEERKQELKQQDKQQKSATLNQLTQEQTLRMSDLDELVEEFTATFDPEVKSGLFSTILKDWNIVTSLHWEISKLDVDKVSKYFEENKFKQLRTLIAKIQGQSNSKSSPLKSEVENQQPQMSVNRTNNISLPQIKIPIFTGNYEEWTPFEDMFKNVIHNNEALSEIEKMNYLKAHVTGEAGRAIQHFQISSANYHIAWGHLKERYSNERLITNKLINKILDLPDSKQESSEQLKEIYNTTKECLKAIEALNMNTSQWDPIIGCVLLRKIDKRTQELFEASLINPLQVPELDEMLNFILKRFRAIESISTDRHDGRENNSSMGSYQPHQRKQQSQSCKYCNLSNHTIYQCLKFKALTAYQRFNTAKEKRLCLNCLNHDLTTKCLSFQKCRICFQNHHTLIHKENNHNKTKTPNEQKSKPYFNQSNRVGTHVAHEGGKTLLATAIIRIQDSDGKNENLRALIDSGSQASFITMEAANLLQLPKQKIHAEISGIGGSTNESCKYKISVQCKPRITSKFTLNTELLILQKLAKDMPEHPIEVNTELWQNKILADPGFGKPGPIDVILGAQEFHEILLEGIDKSNDGLVAQNTELGWIIWGSIHQSLKQTNIAVVSMITQSEEKELSRFWELEEISEKRQLTSDENACEAFYDKTTLRNSSGTYTVQIPFKNEIESSQLGESRPRALARLLSLEKRLSNDYKLNLEYKKFMSEYIKLGHMKQVQWSNQIQGKYYIPHQPVIKETSTTTKLRVVFDASSKTTNGKSLNDIMHVGPKIQDDLIDILLRWRSHRIGFTADIEKMYRQIRISEEDQDYHRILWRFSTNDPIQEFKLLTVTYGTAAAPYLAVKTIQRLAEDEKMSYPTASKISLQDFYVDDLMSGAEDEREAIETVNELISMFKASGITLRKWSSNNREVIKAIPVELRDESAVNIQEDDTRRSLGLLWSPSDDSIRFKVALAPSQKLSKRTILADIAKLFDPLGWLSPVLVKAKLIMQTLWLEKLSWDEEVSQEIAACWNKFRQQLKSVEEISIPRWTYQSTKSKIELHGFSDASEKAYGAVVYVKIINNDESIKITLLTAKSKVAPIKTKTTLPKLELCAAVLLARLLTRVKTALRLNKTPTYAWIDSMIALSWIQGTPNNWKTFVANRVSEIQNLVPSQHWNHVKSEENVADVISRGIDPSKIKDFVPWWQGPTWLQGNKYPVNAKIPETEEERKKSIQVNVAQRSEPKIHEKISTLLSMNRIIAYCYRFINNCKKTGIRKGTLTIQEISNAEEKIVRLEQAGAFHAEIQALKSNKTIDKQSKIVNLSPFIDKNNILRVGGRLKHSLLKYTEKHPIILPGRCHLTNLIIRDAHNTTLHGGNQNTLAFIRRKFWLINGKKAVKKIINNCVKCIRYKAATAQQLMGQLPPPRVTQSAAFLHTGIDYAGPIQVRTTKGRGNKSYKGYIVVFVCLATKAQHLELVSDMLAETFLAALKRFISRRGKCAHIYSDNGTTFVGANNLIESEVIALLRKEKIEDRSTSLGIQWHFIPPSAPHFGGLWEAGVKSTKYHLRRVIGDTTLTFEELYTLLTLIEASLNSRPLCPLSEDINDVAVLTPGHFLIGRELLSPITPICEDIISNMNQRWKMIQKMRKEFWNTWMQEYIHQLQQRYKWTSKSNNLETGEVVILKEDNVKPSQWPLARITEAHADKDGIVRVVSIKKPGGVITKRPIHKLIPLRGESEKKAVEYGNERNQFKGKTRSANLWKKAVVAILFILSLVNSAKAQYKIEYPKPGLYIEHIGQAKIERGIFRIDIKLNKSDISYHIKNIKNVTAQIQNVCQNVAEISEKTECNTLISDMQLKETRLEWVIKGIYDVTRSRKRRGLLGKLMTSIFGVNDEVYTDINNLEKNQQQLIHASSHQTKFMLQALSQFNDTENRIYSKLKQFQEKVIRSQAAITEMKQSWFQAVDENRLSIHLLSSYQVGNNYLDEVYDYYKSLSDILYNTGNIYSMLTPGQIREIIQTAERKMPPSIEILPQPILKTELEETEKQLHVYVYFIVTEFSNFTVVKVSAIPSAVEGDTYLTIDLPQELLASDYNEQKYFHISEEEFKNCIGIRKHLFVCSPPLIRNIENSPNCILDEIYQRTEHSSCPVKRVKIKAMQWIQLYTKNSWIFVSPDSSKVAITCNGNREDLVLNKTGIISISSNCIISTNKISIAARRSDVFPVLAGFIKQVAVNLTTSIKQPPQSQYEENIIHPSDDFRKLKEMEEDIETELGQHHWKSITKHSMFTGALTSAAVVLIIMAVIVAVNKCRRALTTARSQPTTKHKTSSEMIELASLRRHSLNNEA